MTLPYPVYWGNKEWVDATNGIGIPALVLHPQAAFPVNPEPGELILLGSTNVIYVWSGAGWVPIGSSSTTPGLTTNNNTNTVLNGGEALALTESGAVFADAASAAGRCIGLAAGAAAIGAATTLAITGPLSLPTWALPTGRGSLSIGTYYYLSDTQPGIITDVAPVHLGSVVQLIGFAVASNTLILLPQPIIQL